MSIPETHDQSDVTQWFERTYRTLGYRYLRPLEAYPIYLQLLEAVPGDTLLDVGCGPGLLLKAANDRGVAPTGVDISATAIELARNLAIGADLRVANAESLPFADQTFDLLTCIGSLERMFDREKSLAEMRRVATDEARFCFMVRNSKGMGWTVFRQWLRRQNHRGHQDAMDLSSWRRLFEASGFHVDRVLMDQWLRQKVRRALRGFRSHDFRKPEPIAHPVFSMRYVYEYIFLLSKAG